MENMNKTEERRYKNERVDIIVPIYNKEKYLFHCIEDLLAQTYQNIKIILVDDGSTDKSLQICENYAEKDARIKVVKKMNGGVSSARNAGLNTSTADFFSFVDPDDRIEKNLIAELKKNLDQYNADIVYCYDDFTVCSRISNGKMANKKYVLKGKDYDWLGTYAHTVCWGALYRRTIFYNVRFNTSLSVGEDTLFFAHCVRLSRCVIAVEESLYHYCANEDSITFEKWTEKKNDELIAREMICDLFKENDKINFSAKAACAQVCKMIVSKYCGDKNFLEKSCDYYGKKYRQYAPYFIWYYIKKRKFGIALWHGFCSFFWDIYVLIKKKELFYGEISRGS